MEESRNRHFANQSASVRDTLQFAITTICQFTGWTVGHAYLSEVDKDQIQLVSTSIWHACDPARIREFHDVTENTHFNRGVGLPGRVWSEKKAATIRDLPKDQNFPRLQLAQAAGLQGAMALPLMAGEEFFGVIEFLTEQPFEPDADLIEMMTAIAMTAMISAYSTSPWPSSLFKNSTIALLPRRGGRGNGRK